MSKKTRSIDEIMSNEDHAVFIKLNAIMKDIRNSLPDIDVDELKELIEKKYKSVEKDTQIQAGFDIYNMLQSNLDAVNAQTEKIHHVINLYDMAQVKADTYLNKVDQAHIDLGKFTAELANTKGQVDNFKKTITEELKLEAARKLWDKRSKSANTSFKVSSYALGALLIGIPTIGMICNSWVISFFQGINETILKGLSNENKDQLWVVLAISRLVLISLPVMLYIWLIRIIVRFNMRSLLLKDDADQRTTMLETYLHLVEQDVATKADRPIVLEALFRRAPGHGPESIDAPNLTDIINLSKPKGANSTN